MTVTTTLLINGAIIMDVVTKVDDIAEPAQMRNLTTVVVREPADVPKPTVAVIGSALDMEPFEIELLKRGADAVTDLDYARGQ